MVGCKAVPLKVGAPPVLAVFPAYSIVNTNNVAPVPQLNVPVAGLAVVVFRAVVGMRTF